MNAITLHFDGLCEPNPGLGAWGWLLAAPGRDPVCGLGTCPGQVTNNVAEYTAMGKGLRHVLDHADQLAGCRLVVRGDSQLVIYQMTGRYQCGSPALLPYFRRARERAAELEAAGVPVAFEWVPREQNAAADALSVLAWENSTGRRVPERPAKR